MPIGNCQHCVIEWLKLYEAEYVEAFSELVDPARFEQVHASVEEAD